jgi:hypothetical protein
MIGSQVYIPALTVIVYVVQFFTGFFIPVEFQMGILYGINLVARMALGRDLFSGQIKPAVLKKFDINNESFRGKKIYTSKTFWLLIIGFASLGVNAVIHIWGVDFNLLKYTVPALGVITMIIGAITKRPVELK